MSSIRASAPLTGAPPAAAGGTAAPKRSTALPSVHDALRGIPKFSAQLELAVAESLPEKMSEPLYAPDFDPIAHLNQVFPDESSLSIENVDGFLSQVQRDVASLSEVARTEVRMHSEQRDQTRDALASASASIVHLSGKINDIKAKAMQSEAMVHGVCRDITALDHAKRHIKATITALRNLHMLVTAVTHLKTWTERRDFGEAARLLTAITDLFTLFEPYKSVPKLRDLRTQAQGLQEQLRVMVLSDLKTSLLTSAPSASYADVAAHLHNACLILDAMPLTHKQQFLAAFYRLQMEPYERLFGPGKEGFTVEAIPRRYAWLRREVKVFDERYADVFPASWHSSGRFVYEFCVLSRAHVSAVLQASSHGTYALLDTSAPAAAPVRAATTLPSTTSASAAPARPGAAGAPSMPARPVRPHDPDEVVLSASDFGLDSTPSAAAGTSAAGADGATSGEDSAAAASAAAAAAGIVTDADVAQLTAAMLKTVDFEREMAQKYRHCAPKKEGESPADAAAAAAAAAASAAAAAKKSAQPAQPAQPQWASPSSRNSKTAERRIDSASTGAAASGSGAGSSLVFEVSFDRLVSAAFVPYLGGLVLTERRQLADLLDRVAREELWTGPRAAEGEPEGSGEKQLKPRQRFAGSDELFLYFKKSIAHCTRLTTEVPFLNLITEYLRSLDRYAGMMEARTRRRDGQELSRPERISACLVVNTAESIVETLPSFVESVTKKLAPGLEARLGPVTQQDRFEALATRAMAALVGSLLTRAGNDMMTISRTNWPAFAAVGDVTPAVARACAALHSHVGLAAILLSPKYHAFLCLQAASGVLSVFRAELFLSRGVGPMAAQQFAVDIMTVRAALLELPTVYWDAPAGILVQRGTQSRASARVYQRQISRELGHLEALIKVLGAPDEALVAQFRLLLPNSGADDLRQLLEIRGLRGGAATTKIKDLEAELRQAGGIAEPGGGNSAVFSAPQLSGAAAAGVPGAAASGAGAGAGASDASLAAALGAPAPATKEEGRRGAFTRFVNRVMN